MKKLFFILFSLFALVANAENKHYAIHGTLVDNSTEPGQAQVDFRLDLEELEYYNLVMGEVTYYRKSGRIAKIKVYGYGYDDEYVEGTFHALTLQEFTGTKICGYWSLLFDGDSFVNGSWSLDPDKYYDMKDVEPIPTDNVKTFFQAVDLTEAGGVYKFSYDSYNSYNDIKNEYGGTLELYAQGRNLSYSICQVTPNIAEVRNTSSEFWENKLYIDVADTYYTLFAFDGVMYVMHNNLAEGPSENFGANADIVGCYIATDEAVSDDVRNAFAEEEAFSADLPCTVFELNDAWYSFIGGETTFPDELILRDLDGDGSDEIIARYIPGKTDEYEVSGERYAVFVITEGSPVCVQYASEKNESLEIADGYVIKNTSNARGTRITHYFTKLVSSDVALQATMTEAEIDSWTINGSTVKAKDFKKQVKVNNRIRIEDLTGWRTIPGNQKRNENAARG